MTRDLWIKYRAADLRIADRKLDHIASLDMAEVLFESQPDSVKAAFLRGASCSDDYQRDHDTYIEEMSIGGRQFSEVAQ